MSRILVVGNGHCARSAVTGLSGGNSLSLCTSDKSLATEFSELPKVPDLQSGLNSKFDLVLLAGTHELVPSSAIDSTRILNVHYSLLPQYRGLHSVIWAILNGEEETGITIHEVDRLVDHGPVVWQEPIKIERKTSQEIMMELDLLSERNVSRVCQGYISGKVQGKAQDHTRASYVGKRNRKDCEINWNWSAEFVERFFRALVRPYPLPYFRYQDTDYEVSKVEVLHQSYLELPGHVVYLDDFSVFIKLSDGLLRIFELLRDGVVVPAKSVLGQAGIRLPCK